MVSHILFIELVCWIQQEQVLGKLYWYVNQTPPSDDAPEVSETLAKGIRLKA